MGKDRACTVPVGLRSAFHLMSLADGLNYHTHQNRSHFLERKPSYSGQHSFTCIKIIWPSNPIIYSWTWSLLRTHINPPTHEESLKLRVNYSRLHEVMRSCEKLLMTANSGKKRLMDSPEFSFKLLNKGSVLPSIHLWFTVTLYYRDSFSIFDSVYHVVRVKLFWL